MDSCVECDRICRAVADRTAVVGVVGLGHVGLPLGLAFAKAGLSVIGIDVDLDLVADLARGESRALGAVHGRQAALAAMVQARRFFPTSDFGHVSRCDALLLCVPTPLGRHREPDLSCIEDTAVRLGPRLRAGQLVVLSSTTFPGTTEELLAPRLQQASGLRAGEDFFLAYSPEREDPGNSEFDTSHIPRVVAATTPEGLRAATALYSAVVQQVLPVRDPRVAETSKLLENVFRAVNIALVNEVKQLCHAMQVDVWEVIEAAASKPFGFMSFKPGPGLGGHCIPIDPFYLSWKAREYGQSMRFIELAGEVNLAMPAYVVERTVRALNDRGKAVRGAKILVLGVAYKAGVADTRESPALRLITLLTERQACVRFHDPFVPEVTTAASLILKSVALDQAALADADAVLIATDHPGIDYAWVVEHAALVIDTRHATASVTQGRDKIVDA